MSENTTALAAPITRKLATPNVPSDATINSLWRLAQFAAASGMTKTKNAYDALFIITYGWELGISPMSALRTIYAVNGVPTCSGEAMLALIRRSGLAKRIEITHDKTSASVTMQRADTDETYTVVFTLSDAAQADLYSEDPKLCKDNWRKYPQTMMRWRAVSQCAKFLFSDVVGGLHTVEEIAPDIPLDEHGEPIGEVIIGKETPPKDRPVPPANGNGKSSAPANVTDFPKTGGTESWLEVKDEKGETGETRLLVWLRQKYEMTSEEALKLLSKTTWTDYPNGKAACNAVTDAIENSGPPKPQNAASDSNRAEGWTDEDDVILSEAIWNSFNKLTADVLQSLGKTNFHEGYSSRDKAWNAVRGLALAQNWPVVMEKATYNGSYVILKGPFDIRVYGRSTKFKEMVGETYYESNNIEDWEKGDILYEVEPLLITWERKGDKNPYLVATTAKPLFDETEDVPESADPELDDLLEFFGGKGS